MTGTMHRRTRGVIALVATAAFSTSLAACSGSSSAGGNETPSSGATSSSPQNDALRNMVPADIRSMGTVPVAGVTDYPPLSYEDQSTRHVAGANVDLSKAIGDELGLNFQYGTIGFDSLIPALQSKRFYLGWGGFVDTKARQKVVTMVDYLELGASLFAKSDSTIQPGTSAAPLKSLCGKALGVQTGSAYETFAQSESAKCSQFGAQPIDLKEYPAETDIKLALGSGRIDAGLIAQTDAAYTIKRTGSQYKTIGPVLIKGPTAVAVTKSEPQLATAVQAAMQALVDNGTYATIMQKWGLQGGVVSKVQINAATQ